AYLRLGCALVSYQWQPGMFACVKTCDIDVDEAHVGTLKCRLRRSGEVRIACADADDEVRMACNPVGGQRAGGADRTQLKWLIESQRALTVHGLRHRYASAVDEVTHCLCGFALDS